MKFTNDFWERFIQKKRKETVNCGAILFCILGVYLLIVSYFFNSCLKNEAIITVLLAVFALLISYRIDVYRIKKRSYGSKHTEAVEVIDELNYEGYSRKISFAEVFFIAHSIGGIVYKKLCCDSCGEKNVYVYKYKAHPFDDWRFFHVKAESQEKANKKARREFGEMFRAGQTTMKEFYPVKNKKS